MVDLARPSNGPRQATSSLCFPRKKKSGPVSQPAVSKGREIEMRSSCLRRAAGRSGRSRAGTKDHMARGPDWVQMTGAAVHVHAVWKNTFSKQKIWSGAHTSANQGVACTPKRERSRRNERYRQGKREREGEIMGEKEKERVRVREATSISLYIKRNGQMSTKCSPIMHLKGNWPHLITSIIFFNHVEIIHKSPSLQQQQQQHAFYSLLTFSDEENEFLRPGDDAHGCCNP